ncbi:MAG TPA: LysM peptidoglycan-binding domain-containing protein [Opitutales bacterium]|nr:LysM peptidoglycan-binding domain-containing protein [Opitutales bacterium]
MHKTGTMWNRRQFIKTALLAAAALPAATRGFAAAGAAETYSVRKGDTLTSISNQSGVSISDLRALNGLQGDHLVIGQKLIIKPAPPPAQIYTVKSGDTLGQIAQRHKTSVAAIQKANKLSGDRIFPGQELVISGGNGATSRRYIDNVVRQSRNLSISRNWQYIVVHHSGVNNGNARSYDRFHRNQMRMPNGLAYHFVIGNGIDSRNGEIEIGNRWLKQLQGGHVRNYRVNETGIGICLVGNFEVRHPTAQQLAAMNELIHYLKYELLGGRGKVTVHREIDGNRTLCPGKNFPIAQLHQDFP